MGVSVCLFVFSCFIEKGFSSLVCMHELISHKNEDNLHKLSTLCCHTCPQHLHEDEHFYSPQREVELGGRRKFFHSKLNQKKKNIAF